MGRLAAAVWRFLRRTPVRRVVAFLSLPAFLVAVALWAPDREPPIFDVQVHYNEESWERVRVSAIMHTADDKNIPWMLVGSTPNEGTWRLHQANPDRVIPMLTPYRSRSERETWFDDPRNLSYLLAELDARPYRGIGEFALFEGQVDRPVVREMVDVARKRNLVLHARSDQFVVEQLFAWGPDLRIIWAHAGIFASPDTIGKMLDRHPRLWVELSHRGDVAPKGDLGQEWREVMLRHPTRFLLGSGTYNKEYWYQFRYYHDRYRGWLKTLPTDVAERIAFRNGLELFGIRYGGSPLSIP